MFLVFISIQFHTILTFHKLESRLDYICHYDAIARPASTPMDYSSSKTILKTLRESKGLDNITQGFQKCNCKIKCSK